MISYPNISRPCHGFPMACGKYRARLKTAIRRADIGKVVPSTVSHGGYMINTSHLDQRPLYEMPSLSLHEAVPGHHLQIALGQENGELPLFRRQSDMTVSRRRLGALRRRALASRWGFIARLMDVFRASVDGNVARCAIGGLIPAFIGTGWDRRRGPRLSGG